MSDAEPAALPFVLPADFALARLMEREEPWGWREWVSIVAAALMHLALLVWLLLLWREAVLNPPAPEIMPITLVFAPPPIHRPAPAPPPPPPSKPDFHTRESGPGDQTTTLPSAKETAPEETRPPSAAAEPAPQEETTALPPQVPDKGSPLPKPAAKPKGEMVPRDARPEAAKPRAKKPSNSQDTTIALGDRESRGDPYLNRLMQLIELHRVYPKVMGQFGLPAEGTAVYNVAVDRDGELRALRVAQSSGVPALDEAGARMLRSAAPFPPLPNDYPDGVVIAVTLHLSPSP